MKIDIVSLPNLLTDEHLRGRAVVVFDVLRATTTMAAALAEGAKEIRAYDSIAAAKAAAAEYSQPKLLCGEEQCLRPAGFDIGNSPGDFSAERVSGKTIFLSTTNGTRAIVAAAGAARLFAAAFVNAWATADALMQLQMDITLLCAGTNGKPAPEDIAGAETVRGMIEHAARGLSFSPSPPNVVLRDTMGGRNVIAAGLERDIDFAARVNSLNVVVEITGPPAVARKW